MSTSTPTAPTAGADALDPAAEAGRPAADDQQGRDVVVGADGSEVSLRAVRWAAEEAERRGAPLRIVHAAPYLSRPGVAGAPPPEQQRARRITAAAYTVARHTAPSVPASTEIVPGNPVSALLRAGESGQLLVLGIVTTGAADELVVAPVAQRIAAQSSRPVVVVPRRRGPDDTARPLVAVVGLNEREDDEPVAAFAAEAARLQGRPLTVLNLRRHAQDTPDDWTLDPAAWAERFPGLEVRTQHLPGASASRLIGETCPTPLMILSAGHGGLLHRPLDSMHRWLLRHCTSPMAMLPPIHRHTGQEPQEDIIAVG
ncbi:MAG TPA: universal stress protein [Geodermatophilus sp.]|nr:universal stress protein [Geodermatophilus sp.]